MECLARVCPSELCLSFFALGCWLEVFVQFYRYYAPRKGNVNPPSIDLLGFFLVVSFSVIDRFSRGLQLLGDATEQLSLKLGQTLSGLLNASFGNAVEIIVAIAALLQGTVLCYPLVILARDGITNLTPISQMNSGSSKLRWVHVQCYHGRLIVTFFPSCSVLFSRTCSLFWGAHSWLVD